MQKGKPTRNLIVKKTLVAKQLKTAAENIRRIRLERNYTQAYVGDMINLSQNAYSKLELNYTLITLERLIKIAMVLEVDAWELLNWNCASYELKQPVLNKSKTY